MSKQSAEEAFEIGLFLSVFSESVRKAFPDLSDEQRMTYAVQVWQYPVYYSDIFLWVSW